VGLEPDVSSFSDGGGILLVCQTSRAGQKPIPDLVAGMRDASGAQPGGGEGTRASEKYPGLEKMSG